MQVTGEMLLSGLVGAIIGMALEATTSFFGAVFSTLTNLHLTGEYSHAGGVVVITLGFRRLVTEGRENIPANSWQGSFSLDDPYMKIGRGAYRHIDRQNDWGYHYLHVLPNGDISVQWENMSAGQQNRGALIWQKR